MAIHPTAIVDPGAELGADIDIGPFSVIDAHVAIGARTTIGSHVRITGHTTIGEDCQIFSGAVLGEPPQDTKYKREVSYLRIGHRNIIREFVTMHLASGEGNATEIGDENMLMAYSHVGHNCVIGNRVCLANYVGLSGGCRIDDRVIMGGMSGLHQYVHVGRMTMIGGYCKVAHDIPPFVIVDGPPMKVYGLNSVGLRRGGIEAEVRNYLKQTFRTVYRTHKSLGETLALVRQEVPALPEIEEFLAFLERSGLSGRHLDPSHTKNASAPLS